MDESIVKLKFNNYKELVENWKDLGLTDERIIEIFVSELPKLGLNHFIDAVKLGIKEHVTYSDIIEWIIDALDKKYEEIY
ncbi:MAG: hypothetical protein QXU98_13290 [Candidatus Parvarchaeota archaeon]